MTTDLTREEWEDESQIFFMSLQDMNLLAGLIVELETKSPNTIAHKPEVKKRLNELKRRMWEEVRPHLDYGSEKEK